MGKKTKVGIAIVALAIGAGIAQRRKEIKRSRPHKLDNAENVLILGSGGILGLAWHAATLKRLQYERQWNPEDDHLRIGTSAGSLVAMALGAGLSLDVILDAVSGKEIEHNGGKFTIPDLPTEAAIKGEKSDKWYILRTLSRLHIPYLGIILSSLVPEGEVSLKDFIDFVDGITGKEWPETRTWITTTELSDGKRHVFSASSAVSPGFAVASSCSVPAMYKPLSTEVHNFVDGGVISSLHLDLALDLGVKKITALAPISGFVCPSIGDNLAVGLRKAMRNFQEVALFKAQIKAKAKGIELIVIRPRAEERKILNKNRLMDASLLSELIEATLKVG